jgi:hypothetical protein
MGLLVMCGSLYAQSYFERIPFPNSNIQIETTCANDECSIFLIKNKRRKFLLKDPSPPAAMEIDKGVILLSFSCGTECSATYFYSVKRGLSGPFPLVLDKNMAENMVLSVVNNTVCVFHIYDKQKGHSPAIARIKLDLPRGDDIVLAINDTKAIPGGFSIDYTDSNGKKRTATWKAAKK